MASTGEQGKIRDPNLASHWNISSIERREVYCKKVLSDNYKEEKNHAITRLTELVMCGLISDPMIFKFRKVGLWPHMKPNFLTETR